MKIDFKFRPYYYIYDKLIDKAKRIGEELNEHLAGKCYVSDLQLDELTLIFINTQNMKCRVRPDYRKTRAPMDGLDVFSLMALYFEINGRFRRIFSDGIIFRNPHARNRVHQGER